MNIIINWSLWHFSDIPQLFEDEGVLFSNAISLEELCVEMGIYKSRGQSRKCGRWGDLPRGYSEMKVSKKTVIYLWNPSVGIILL